MRIIVDIDGPCADLVPTWLNAWNNAHGAGVCVGDIKTWNIEKYTGDDIFDFYNASLYDDVEHVPGAVDALRFLSEGCGHEIVYVTVGDSAKQRWLADNGFPFYTNYVVTDRKYLVSGDVIIDDYEKNTDNYPGYRILWAAPWNLNAPDSSFDDVASDWSQAVMLIEKYAADHPDLKCKVPAQRPLQTKAFKRILDYMFEMYLTKNSDYSSANILGTGEMGLMTRVWDKVARLMNLMGYKIEISNMNFEAPSVPKHESIDDTIGDLAVYAVIWRVYRMGVWGK